MFKLQMRTMDLFLLLGLILTGAPRPADGQESVTVTVTVTEGHEAILPCSVSTNMEPEMFDWRNKDKEEVFYYERGAPYGSERDGQHQDFKGRVFHFPDQLRNGNASIRITNTKMADSGAYSCYLPNQDKWCHVQLEVGVCPKPHFASISINKQYLLQCEVHGVSPDLHLEIKDSSGTVLHAQRTESPADEGAIDIVLQIKVTKYDDYTCVATQEDICHQIFSKTYVGPLEPVTVRVAEGHDVILPCSVSTSLEPEMFDWKKEDKDEVFFYEKGGLSGSGRHGQHEDFKGRVSHFPDQLKNGNTSIRINNTKMADRGAYSCFLPKQDKWCHVQLEVACVDLKDQTGKKTGVCPKPHLTHLMSTNTWDLLQCEVHGVSSQLRLELKDSSGIVLNDQPTKESKDGINYNMVLQTNVTKSGVYSCVVTQENICHQISSNTSVYVHGPAEDSTKGVCPKPHFTSPVINNQFLLQCEIHGVSSRLQLEIKDSSGTVLSDQPKKEPKGGGTYDMVLQTKVTKSDDYTCVATEEDICHQIFSTTYVYVPESVTVTVKVREGHDVILPCSVSTNLEPEIFDWRNKDNDEVFFYERGGSHGSKRDGQHKDFENRVSHFPDQLKNGNASIRISNTKIADRGAYSCYLPHQEKLCLVQLEVGACPKPHFAPTKINNQYLLQCEVSGVSSQLQLEIKDSSGTVLSDQPKKEPKDKDTYNMVLQTKVTKTDDYTCVATQKHICHQIFSTTYVYVPDSTTSNVVIGVLVVLVILLVGVFRKRILRYCRRIVTTPVPASPGPQSFEVLARLDPSDEAVRRGPSTDTSERAADESTRMSP